MPTLLLTKDFEGEVGTVNLSTHDSGWQYVGDPDRFEVVAAGYARGKSTSDDPNSIASHDYDVPTGVSVRLIADVTRGGVDFVGGAMLFSVYIRAAARGVDDLTDRLELGIRRVSLGSVQMAAVWYKPTGELPAQVAITSNNVVMNGTQTKRFIWDIIESTGMVRQYVADAFTGENVVLVSEGTGVDASLIAHGAGDRHPGFATRRAASGLVEFRLQHLEIYDIADALPPLAGTPCTHLLEAFDDDRTTVLWAVATDPGHPFPYLDEPEDYAEQSIDVAKGAATIGTVRARVLDKAPAGDQDGGFMVAKLADAGLPSVSGRRCRWTRFDELGNPIVMIDGPASLPSMDSTYAAFEFVIEDTRETERKVRCFDDILPNVDASEDEADTDPTTGGVFSGIAWNTQLY